ncbi:MAG: BON domain-containing protein [Sheuella sp.]|nr:BON domain-containing protein [Sheuella sp.]
MRNPIKLIRPVLFVVMLASMTTMLQGCIGIALTGAAAATGLVVVDRRTTAQQADDKLIELKVNNHMRTRFGDTARINSTVYQAVVLLTGEALIEEIKAQAGEIASKVENVKSVSNQVVVVQEISPFSVIANDAWITSKVMTTLATTKEIPSRTIVVTTDRSVVYLMGLVTQREGDLAAAATAQVSGVKRVEKFFQIISPTEANKLDSMTGASKGTGTPLGESAPINEGALPPAAAPGSGAVEVMPIK